MKTCTKSLSLILLLLLAPVASADIIVPQIGGAIDPAGGGDIDFDATGSAPLAVFDSHVGNVRQANWNGISGTTGNTINHDAGGLDDGINVRIEHVTTFPAAINTSASYNTSSVGNGYQWTGTNGQQLEISFGTQTTSFSNNRTVGAAGLALMNFGSAYTDVTIEYLDSGDNVLSSQSFAGTGDPSGGGADFFTGYISTSQNIAKVTIDLTRDAGDSPIALDALTFSTVSVPEPSSAAIFGFGIVLLTGRRRRGATPAGS